MRNLTYPKNREAQKAWCIVSQRVDTVLDNYRSAQVLGFFGYFGDRDYHLETVLGRHSFKLFLQKGPRWVASNDYLYAC